MNSQEIQKKIHELEELKRKVELAELEAIERAQERRKRENDEMLQDLFAPLVALLAKNEDTLTNKEQEVIRWFRNEQAEAQAETERQEATDGA